MTSINACVQKFPVKIAPNTVPKEGALVFNALFPLDAISGEKLLYSNPRLLRSSHLGETCPYPFRRFSGALLTASASLPFTDVNAARPRPGERPAAIVAPIASYLPSRGWAERKIPILHAWPRN